MTLPAQASSRAQAEQITQAHGRIAVVSPNSPKLHLKSIRLALMCFVFKQLCVQGCDLLGGHGALQCDHQLSKPWAQGTQGEGSQETVPRLLRGPASPLTHCAIVLGAAVVSEREAWGVERAPHSCSLLPAQTHDSLPLSSLFQPSPCRSKVGSGDPRWVLSCGARWAVRGEGVSTAPHPPGPMPGALPPLSLDT